MKTEEAAWYTGYIDHILVTSVTTPPEKPPFYGPEAELKWAWYGGWGKANRDYGQMGELVRANLIREVLVEKSEEDPDSDPEGELYVSEWLVAAIKDELRVLVLGKQRTVESLAMMAVCLDVLAAKQGINLQAAIAAKRDETLKRLGLAGTK